jgi:hypothetical protein
MQLNQFYRNMQRERQTSSETVSKCFIQTMIHVWKEEIAALIHCVLATLSVHKCILLKRKTYN